MMATRIQMMVATYIGHAKLNIAISVRHHASAATLKISKSRRHFPSGMARSGGRGQKGRSLNYFLANGITPYHADHSLHGRSRRPG